MFKSSIKKTLLHFFMFIGFKSFLRTQGTIINGQNTRPTKKIFGQILFTNRAVIFGFAHIDKSAERDSDARGAAAQTFGSRAF